MMQGRVKIKMIKSCLPGFSEINLPLALKGTDILLFAAGFEERSIVFPSNLCAEQGAHAVVLDYQPADPRNQLAFAVNLVEGIGVTTETIPFNRLDADEAWAWLEASIRQKSVTHNRIVLDISGLSKIGILLAMEAARLFCLELLIVYAEAELYHPTHEEYAKAKGNNNILQPSLQIYSGIEGVLCASVLSSVAMQGQPICLVSFMSFNENFTQTLLNRLNPSHLFLINGKPPHHTWREEATAWIHERLVKEWAQDDVEAYQAVSRCTSTLDYRETFEEISKIYWSTFVTHRMIVAPCGSKMQAIGTYMAKAVHPDIQIEYPVARGYLDQYSYRVGSLWQIDFGHLSDRIKTIKAAETAKYIMI